MNNYVSKIPHNARIFVVRHAETQHNVEHRVAGGENSPLTELGIAQATFTGQFFADKSISVILHSPLDRTLHTAKLIKNQIPNCDAPFVLCNELIEIDAGVWTHKNLIELEKQDPQLFALFRQHSWECVPEAERISSLVERSKKVWKVLTELIIQGHKNVLVVSHGGFINWLFKTSFGLEGQHLKHWSPVVKSKNCGIYELVIETSEEGAFCFWNRINYTCYN